MKTPRRKTAVALRYDAAKDAAPRVTAKGHGLLADKILALAREKGVPIREDADLVQALAQLDLQQEIPPSLYRAVAEILAFVYRLNAAYGKR
ncbi:MAG: flagellar biosynthetic protein FlhB [Candidatus Tectimicrobiota bacterium]|nr:MAG: flagellar biosynthetic protein FlhB [Candidatus Tectomicrobia bacterium]